METLMSFVPPIHQEMYKNIIDDHRLIIDEYKKKKKKSNGGEDGDVDNDAVEELF